ncbi:MAG: TRAM domain-containing protein [Planctomycetes bacterium]|nr:TRAM domain-containing protein [Planctomycetota bacterium]
MTERVRIERIATGGDGVGRLTEGRVVFVPRTAPGDVIDLGHIKRHKGFARAEIGGIVEPSPQRVAPKCQHYDADSCGGCALQHMTYEAQLAAKATFVNDAFARIAKLPVPPVEVVPNPRPFGWRTRLSVTVDIVSGDVGLHPIGLPDEVFDLVSCPISTEGLQRLWTALNARRDLWPGRCERLTIREDRAGGLHVVAHETDEWLRAADVAEAMLAAGVTATLWAQPTNGTAVVAAGPSSSGATFFEQVDPAMGDVVRAYALSLLGDVTGLRVWDLYAGIGETSAALAAAGADVESVEADALAVDESNRRGPATVRRYTSRVEDILDRLGAPALVIANPPRSGLGPVVTDALAARGARRIVYVSCDPATLARDVARLVPGYHVESVKAFDSFPQTAHVETVVSLGAGAA